MPELWAVSSRVPNSLISAPRELIEFFARNLWEECANIQGHTVHPQAEFSYMYTPLLNSGGATHILHMAGNVYTEGENRVRIENERVARERADRAWEFPRESIWIDSNLQQIQRERVRRTIDQLYGMPIIQQDEQREMVSDQYASQQIAEQERRIDAARPRRSIDELLADIDEQIRPPSEVGVDGGTASNVNANERGKISYMDKNGNWQEEEQIFL